MSFFPSIPVDLSNRFGDVCTMSYCTCGRNLKLSIDTYEFDPYMKTFWYNRLLLLYYSRNRYWFREIDAIGQCSSNQCDSTIQSMPIRLPIDQNMLVQ